MKLFLFFFLLFSNLFSLNKDKGIANDDNAEQMIEWSESYKLKWDDFQGDPAQNKFAAMTCSDISVKSFKTGKDVTYTVKCSFKTNKSWTRSKSQRVLAHEQLHFDITELHGRILRKKFSDVGVALSKEEFKTTVDKVFADWNKMEKLYDKECRHGLNKEKQKEWEEMVERKLNELEDYKSSAVTVKGKEQQETASHSQCKSHICALH
ncbi:DUF922 domain-containing protein [Cytophagaceae bacterium ABcell3]|nr:DUF922 domain-containing protein [Cytophagaceae bacterium ABcell3]